MRERGEISSIGQPRKSIESGEKSFQVERTEMSDIGAPGMLNTFKDGKEMFSRYEISEREEQLVKTNSSREERSQSFKADISTRLGDEMASFFREVVLFFVSPMRFVKFLSRDPLMFEKVKLSSFERSH